MLMLTFDPSLTPHTPHAPILNTFVAINHLAINFSQAKWYVARRRGSSQGGRGGWVGGWDGE